MEIKNLKKAAQRIKKAIKKKENIVIFSDADLDGTISLIILEEAIKTLGGEIRIRYFPDREREGYGLSIKTLNYFKKYSPGLLILLDSGMSNFKEIEKAKKIDFETIIIDHHQPLSSLPKASIIVNPQIQKDDSSFFKFLAASGVTFKLVKEMLGKKISKNILDNFFELVALATLADMMPQKKENLIFIEKGLRTLPCSFRPGLRAFLKFFPFKTFSSREIAQKIISVAQVTDLKNHLTESYLLFSAKNEQEAEQLIRKLLEKQKKRKKLVQFLLGEIEKKIKNHSSVLIFEGNKQIPHLLTGNIASKLCNKFQKPTFIFTQKKDVIRGSIRMPKGLNGVKALESCSSFLEIYGGHPQAAGFTVQKKNLEKFKECLERYFKDVYFQ